MYAQNTQLTKIMFLSNMNERYYFSALPSVREPKPHNVPHTKFRLDQTNVLEFLNHSNDVYYTYKNNLITRLNTKYSIMV
jgi:hypothetical protein